MQPILFEISFLLFLVARRGNFRSHGNKVCFVNPHIPESLVQAPAILGRHSLLIPFNLNCQSGAFLSQNKQVDVMFRSFSVLASEDRPESVSGHCSSKVIIDTTLRICFLRDAQLPEIVAKLCHQTITQKVFQLSELISFHRSVLSPPDAGPCHRVV